MDRLKSTLITLFFFLSAGNSWAAIVSVSGDMTLIPSPTSVQQDQLESDSTVWSFVEQQSYTLTSDLSVDEVVGTGTDGLITAGTQIDSYFIHADPVGNSGLIEDAVTLNATITFDQKIIGLIWSGVACPSCPSSLMYLDASDYLGNSGTAYPTDGLGRGFEVEDHYAARGTQDFITISADGYSLTTISSAALPLYSDQLRVITASAVPLPMSVWLLGSGLIGLVGLGRKRLK